MGLILATLLRSACQLQCQRLRQLHGDHNTPGCQLKHAWSATPTRGWIGGSTRCIRPRLLPCLLRQCRGTQSLSILDVGFYGSNMVFLPSCTAIAFCWVYRRMVHYLKGSAVVVVQWPNATQGTVVSRHSSCRKSFMLQSSSTYAG